MVSFFRATKFGGALVTAALMLAGVSTPSQAQTGTVYLKTVAFIVGGGGGSGVLIYQGHRYPLKVSGIGIGSIGIAEAKMSGIAYNLHRPSDITRHLFGGGRGPRGSRRRTGGAAAKRAWRASQTARRATRLSSDARCRRDDHLDALTRGPNAGLALKMQAELRRRPADVGVV